MYERISGEDFTVTQLSLEQRELVLLLAERLGAISGISAVVLGGSHARGLAQPGSDIDLGLFYSEAAPFSIQSLRELAEEIGVETKVACLAPLTFASHSYESFNLLMPLFVCRRFWGTPVPKEVAALKWVRPRHLRDYPMPPADTPLIPFLIDLL